MSVSIADVFFLGRLTPAEQAAGNYGFLIFLVISVIGLGLSNGLSVLIARRCGEGLPQEAGRLMVHGIVLMLAYALLAYVFVKVFLADVLRAALRDTSLQQQVLNYAYHRAPELFFSLPVLVLNAFHVGTARPRPVTLAAFTGAACNIVLDDAWIFGKYGFPERRVAGAALATVVVQILVFLQMLAATLLAPGSRPYLRKLSGRLSRSVFRAIAVVSGPLFLQNGLSIVSWLWFFTLIERADLRLLEASSVVRAFYGLTLMPAIALNATVSSMVSNFLGQGRVAGARAFIRRLMAVGYAFGLPWLMVITLAYASALRFFSIHASVVALAAETRWSLAAAVLLMPAVFTLFASITGTGHTRATLIIESGSLGFYLLYVAWVCGWDRPSLAWIWFSEPVYYILLGGASMAWHLLWWRPRHKVRFF
jgi:putative MATE family efflux protein